MDGQTYWLGRWAQALRAGTTKGVGVHRQAACATDILFDELRADGLMGEDVDYQTCERLGLSWRQFILPVIAMNDREFKSRAEIATWLEDQIPAEPTVTLIPLVADDVFVLASR